MIRNELNRILTKKYTASYWLGLIAYDRGEWSSAADFFQKRTLDFFKDQTSGESPTGFWTAGAGYNLARTYEQQGEFNKAIVLYIEDKSPQRHGNLLRARWLKRISSAQKAMEKSTSTQTPDP